MQSLALQASLHVGDGDDDGVDRAGLDPQAKIGDAQARLRRWPVALIGSITSAPGGPAEPAHLRSTTEPLRRQSDHRLDSRRDAGHRPTITRADRAAAPRCRRSAPPSPCAPLSRSPTRIASTMRRCWASEWSRLRSITGIAASSRSIVTWTSATAAASDGEPLAAAIARCSRESATRRSARSWSRRRGQAGRQVGAIGRGEGTGGRQPRGARLDDAAEVERVVQLRRPSRGRAQRPRPARRPVAARRDRRRTCRRPGRGASPGSRRRAAPRSPRAGSPG